MMKVKCVNNRIYDELFTVGNEYKVIRNNPGYPLCIINNKNQEWLVDDKDFELIPDVPDTPKSEWMRCDCDTFVNMVTGMTLTFFDNGYHHANISHIATPDNWCTATHDEADTFAALVGYNWPSAGKEM
jgi:hypothetical protein